MTQWMKRKMTIFPNMPINKTKNSIKLLIQICVSVQLFQILEKRRLTKELAEKIDEKSERVKILEEHLKNVKSELLNT